MDVNSGWIRVPDLIRGGDRSWQWLIKEETESSNRQTKTVWEDLVFRDCGASGNCGFHVNAWAITHAPAAALCPELRAAFNECPTTGAICMSTVRRWTAEQVTLDWLRDWAPVLSAPGDAGSTMSRLFAKNGGKIDKEMVIAFRQHLESVRSRADKPMYEQDEMGLGLLVQSRYFVRASLGLISLKNTPTAPSITFYPHRDVQQRRRYIALYNFRHHWVLIGARRTLTSPVDFVCTFDHLPFLLRPVAPVAVPASSSVSTEQSHSSSSSSPRS